MKRTIRCILLDSSTTYDYETGFGHVIKKFGLAKKKRNKV